MNPTLTPQDVDTGITIQDVEKAWDDQAKACDWYARTTLFDAGEPWNKTLIEQAFEDMQAATEYAELLQSMYDDQYNDRLSFDKKPPLENPQYCNHVNAIMTYNEADGQLWHCPDCDALLAIDQAGEWEIVKVEKEIPY